MHVLSHWHQTRQLIRAPSQQTYRQWARDRDTANRSCANAIQHNNIMYVWLCMYTLLYNDIEFYTYLDNLALLWHGNGLSIASLL